MNARCSMPDSGAKHYQQFLTCELQWIFIFTDVIQRLHFSLSRSKPFIILWLQKQLEGCFSLIPKIRDSFVHEVTTDKGGADSCPNMPPIQVWIGKKKELDSAFGRQGNHKC